MQQASDGTIFDEFLRGIGERLRSPLVFAFFFSYFIYHMDAFIYLVLSDANVDERIRYFQMRLELGPNGGLFESSFFPLVMAMIFVTVVPVLSAFITMLKAFIEKYENMALNFIGVGAFVKQDVFNAMQCKVNILKSKGK